MPNSAPSGEIANPSSRVQGGGLGVLDRRRTALIKTHRLPTFGGFLLRLWSGKLPILTTTRALSTNMFSTITPSLRHLVVGALLVAVPSASAATLVAEDGPNKLDDCTSCGPIYKTMVKCQTIKRPGGIGSEIKNCICVPNPDGWYGYIHQCRDCLSSPDNDFFNNLASMITQLFTSCTNAGGNVVSDGESICASNAMWDLCASLKDGGDNGALSWASFERFSDHSSDSNVTPLLHLEGGGSGSAGSSSSSSSRKTTATTAAATGTSTDAAESDSGSTSTTSDAASGTAAATGTGSQAPSASTTGSQNATSTDKPSAAAGLRQGSQAGYALGMAAVAGIVGLLVV